LNSSESKLDLKTAAAIGVDLPIADEQSRFVALQSNGGWNALGRITVHMEKDNVGQNALVLSAPTKIAGRGPELQFKLDVFETTPIETDALGRFSEQAISIKRKMKVYLRARPSWKSTWMIISI
jgi:hypothetical protein